MSNLISIGFAVMCIGSGLIMIALAFVLFYSLYQDYMEDKKIKDVERDIKRMLKF